jgi:uncharacterized membrane protein YvlD (DUF360 family)
MKITVSFVGCSSPVTLLSLPFIILTPGWFTLVVDAAMLLLTAAVADSLRLAGFPNPMDWTDPTS